MTRRGSYVTHGGSQTWTHWDIILNKKDNFNQKLMKNKAMFRLMKQ